MGIVTLICRLNIFEDFWGGDWFSWSFRMSHRHECAIAPRFPAFLNFDIAFSLLKAQHLLVLGQKVGQGGLDG